MNNKLISATGVPIDNATLRAIATAPASEVENPAPDHNVQVSETKLRRTTISLIHGTPMPKLTSPAELAMKDKLYHAVIDIHSKGGGVELPFDTVGDDEDYYGVTKFNPNHDELGRFATGPGGEALSSTILGEKTGGQSGSIDGGVYKGKDGIDRYVKFYKEPKQAINERVANEVYYKMGLHVPNAVVFPHNGKGGFASEIMANKGVLGNKYTPDEAQEVSQGLATDILLGNRDVLGMGGTNLLRLNSGGIGRIDHGGALFYRALGVPKTLEALNNLQEIEGFFNPQYDMGRLMQKGGLTQLQDVPDIREQIDQIESLGNKPGSWEQVVADAQTKAPATYDKKLADLLRLRAGKLITWRDNVLGNDLGYDKDLEGPPLEKWASAPKTDEEWKNVEGQMPELQEPAMPKSWKHAAAGVIIKEPDGRVWITEPAGKYGGYKYTFPKGTQEKDLTLQQTAIKEAYEETGLKVKITGLFGDYKRDTSIGRYYTAERTGGDPTDHGWETAKVKLVPQAALDGYMTRGADKQIAAHIVDYPSELPSVPDEKPVKWSKPTQGSFDEMLREYYAQRHGIKKFNHAHYPAGAPGGTGGQFMPTGSPDELLNHLSPGTSSGAILYNNKVKALHHAWTAAPFYGDKDAVKAIANVSSYSGPTHGYAKKFIALKSEAMVHAAAAKAAEPPPLPTPPAEWTASHQQAKWNNGIVKKLTQATKALNPQEAVAYVSVGASAKPFVKNYKDELMKYYAKLNPTIDISVKPNFKNVAELKAYAEQKGAIPKPTALPAEPVLENPANWPVSVKAVKTMTELAHKAKDSHLSITERADAVTQLEAFGGSDIYVLHPNVMQYKKDLLSNLAAGMPKGLPKQNIFQNLPAEVAIPTPPVIHPSDNYAWEDGQKHVDKLYEHAQNTDIKALSSYDLDGAAPGVEAYKQHLMDHFGITPLESKLNKLKDAIKPKDPLVLPDSPAIKPGVPEDQVKIFTAKINQIKAAALMPDPIASIDAIPGQSSSIQSYKQAVKVAILQHQGTGEKEVGDVVASLKVVGKAPIKIESYPAGVHAELNQDAYAFRQALPQSERYALDSYQGAGYGSINAQLRHLGTLKDVSGTASGKSIHQLDKLFEKVSSPKDMVVIRNIGNVEQLQTSAHTLVGHIVQDPAFMSSSLDGGFGSGLPVQLRLNVPKGSKALYLTGSGGPHVSEKEVLIARRSLFRIDKVETKGNGQYYSNTTVIHGTLLPRHLQPKNI